MYLAEEAWPDLRTYFQEESLALVPLGSTEQHGPHLPEGTDHLIAEALAREGADRAGYLCTPPITVGVSSHHRQFHGTMWVDPPVFRDYVESFAENLAYHGIDRIIFVNAHGGNVEHLREVGRRLYESSTAFAVEWMWNESIPGLVDDLFERPGPHGGPKETAMIQHIAEALVHDDRLAEARDDGMADYDDSQITTHGARTYYDTVGDSDNGVFGDQTEATPEKGQRLFEAATEQLVALCEWLADREQSALVPSSHVE